MANHRIYFQQCLLITPNLFCVRAFCGRVRCSLCDILKPYPVTRSLLSLFFPELLPLSLLLFTPCPVETSSSSPRAPLLPLLSCSSPRPPAHPVPLPHPRLRSRAPMAWSALRRGHAPLDLRHGDAGVPPSSSLPPSPPPRAESLNAAVGAWSARRRGHGGSRRARLHQT